MGTAANPRFAIVLLMLLSLGLSLSFPAEDVLDAVYDESEALPYEDTPVFSIVAVPLTSARMAKGESSHGRGLHFDIAMKRCKLGRENNVWILPVPHSLTIIDDSLPLRC